MPKNWSIPRDTYDALGKLSIQRSPAIAKAIWDAKADPTRLVRALEARLTSATAAAKVAERATATAKAENSATAEAPAAAEAPTKAPTTASAGASKLVNGEEYVRVSVSYHPKTAEAVEYLANIFKISYEETVRLALEAYLKRL